MDSNQLIAERFELKATVKRGGGGQVYRAHDRLSGLDVAVKIVEAPTNEAGDEARQRLDQEAQMLAELSHPGIVRYIAHGMTPRGAMFLATEWLEGEVLASRI